MLSEAVKILKGEYALRAITVHNMDKAIVFCRTKVDCDNMENYLNKAGGGNHLHHVSVTHHAVTSTNSDRHTHTHLMALFPGLPG